MEDNEKRRIQTLGIALVVNVVFTTLIVGFMIYKVHSLNNKVVQLQNDLQSFSGARSSPSESPTSMIRRKRSNTIKETTSCKSCHRACVQLFGLGSAAKVIAETFSVPFLCHFFLIDLLGL